MSMGPPTQITPAKLGDYLDVMSKAVFQTGISWKVVAAKWAGTQAAFRDFVKQERENIRRMEDEKLYKIIFEELQALGGFTLEIDSHIIHRSACELDSVLLNPDELGRVPGSFVRNVERVLEFPGHRTPRVLGRYLKLAPVF
ncbi:MAG: hypothetical protein IH987_18395 [Planctomycetes bacterium]|nr:hypothetical protein [Planctomycetota bacterium]